MSNSTFLNISSFTWLFLAIVGVFTGEELWVIIGLVNSSVNSVGSVILSTLKLSKGEE